jgi:hypothetical protein
MFRKDKEHVIYVGHIMKMCLENDSFKTENILLLLYIFHALSNIQIRFIPTSGTPQRWLRMFVKTCWSSLCMV